MYGKLQKVENLDPKNGSNKTYWRVMVEGPLGLETLGVTEKELDRIRARAERNPEDTKMVPTWWDKASAAFAGVF